MTERVRAFLRGAGSLLDIHPDPRRYQELLPKGTTEERLAGHWRRVGQYIAGASQKLDDKITRRPKGPEQNRPGRQ